MKVDGLEMLEFLILRAMEVTLESSLPGLTVNCCTRESANNSALSAAGWIRLFEPEWVNRWTFFQQASI